MEKTKDWLLWLEKILPILDQIDKLSHEEKKDLLELLSLDLDKKTELERLNCDKSEDKKLRDLVNDITSEYY